MFVEVSVKLFSEGVMITVRVCIFSPMYKIRTYSYIQALKCTRLEVT